MIIGECPYDGCDGDIMLGCDGWPMPSFYKHECETCKKYIWTKITRIDPQSFTEEDFLSTHKINEDTKSIKEMK